MPPTPFDPHAELFLAVENVKLAPLRPDMNHTRNLTDPDLIVKSAPIGPKQKFLHQLYAELTQAEATGRVYSSSHTSAYAILMIRKIDKPNEARFLHDVVARKSLSIM